MILFICITIPVFANPQKGENLERKIFWLIEKIEKSNYIFIRNGTEYTSKEAVRHIVKKYEHFKDNINSIEDFIDYAASKSYLTGKPYILKNSKGEIIKLKDWLIYLFNKEYTKVNGKLSSKIDKY